MACECDLPPGEHYLGCVDGQETVDGAAAVIDGTVPRETIVPKLTLDEAMKKVVSARTHFIDCESAAKDAAADKKEAQEALNSAIAVAVSVYNDEHNPQMTLGE